MISLVAIVFGLMVLLLAQAIANLIEKHKDNAILIWIVKIERQIMASQTEIADGLTQLTAQIGKVATEQSTRFDTLTAKINELEAAINAGGDASPAVVDALAGAKTALQSLDDTIPDAPVAAP